MCNKIEPSAKDQVMVMEVDEFWHCPKKCKLWILKAYYRNRQRLIDWEIGDRSRQTFKRLYDRLKKFEGAFLLCRLLGGIQQSYSYGDAVSGQE